MLLATDRGGTLTMLDGAGKTIGSQQNHVLKRLPEFSRLQPQPAAVELRGRRWHLVQVREGERMLATGGGVVITFSAHDESVTGSSSCKSLSGRFSATDAWLILELWTRSSMSCGLENGDKPLASVASQVARYAIEGKTLELKNGDGDTLALLVTP